MREFKEFPKEMICPICCSNENKPCTLLPIDGTESGNNIEAYPFHVDCIREAEYRYNRSVGIIYSFVAEKSG